MSRLSSLANAATADRAMAFIVAGGILLVIILLARAVGRLAKHAHAPAVAAPAPKSSGGRGKLLLLAGAGAGIFAYVKTRHPAAVAAAGAAPSPSPSPSPAPAVTRTVASHITSFHFPLTGGDIVALYVVAAIAAIVIIGQVLRRSS